MYRAEMLAWRHGIGIYIGIDALQTLWTCYTTRGVNINTATIHAMTGCAPWNATASTSDTQPRNSNNHCEN